MKKMAVLVLFLCFLSSAYAEQDSLIIAKVQMSLKLIGFYKGDVTGKKDIKTIVAITKFQEAHKINPEGNINSETVAKLHEILIKKYNGNMKVLNLCKDLVDITITLIGNENKQAIIDLKENYKKELNKISQQPDSVYKKKEKCDQKDLQFNIKGRYLIFDDQEIYESEDEDISEGWSTSDNYIVCDDKIINTDESDDNTVEVSKLSYYVKTVMESTIDGENDGLDSDAIFKLSNGQIWQQIEYAYDYSYSYMRDVWILQTSEGFKIILEDIEDEIVGVKRLK